MVPFLLRYTSSVSGMTAVSTVNIDISSTDFHQITVVRVHICTLRNGGTYGLILTLAITRSLASICVFLSQGRYPRRNGGDCLGGREVPSRRVGEERKGDLRVVHACG